MANPSDPTIHYLNTIPAPGGSNLMVSHVEDEASTVAATLFLGEPRAAQAGLRLVCHENHATGRISWFCYATEATETGTDCALRIDIHSDGPPTLTVSTGDPDGPLETETFALADLRLLAANVAAARLREPAVDAPAPPRTLYVPGSSLGYPPRGC